MADNQNTKIQFKRRTSDSTEAVSLKPGEPFYNTNSKRLYIGNSDLETTSGNKKHIAQITDTNVTEVNNRLATAIDASVNTADPDAKIEFSIGEDTSNTFTKTVNNVAHAYTATSAKITNKDAADNAVVSFQIGNGIAYKKTVNNVAHATSAQNLDNNPTIEEAQDLLGQYTQIKVTAGGKPSNSFTVPYATNATNTAQINVNAITSDGSASNKKHALLFAQVDKVGKGTATMTYAATNVYTYLQGKGITLEDPTGQTEHAISFQPSDGNNGPCIYLKNSDAQQGTLTATHYSGNAATATKWQTPRTITLTGSIEASTSIDGLEDVTIDTTHNHDDLYVNVTGDTMTGALDFSGRFCGPMGGVDGAQGSHLDWWLYGDNLDHNSSPTDPFLEIGLQGSNNPLYIRNYNDSGVVTAVKVLNGEITAKKFIATSDKRLKENLKPFNSNKSILDLPVYKFDYINGAKNNIGCMAQDLMEICPEIVHKNDDGYLSIEESKIVYLLLDEIKKLRKDVKCLKETTT